MKGEIITIGDELLIGQTINTNAAWLGGELARIGVRVIHSSCISDQEEAIINSLNQARHRADVIILTGGLGPTKDDITKQTLCSYFKTKLVLHEPSLERIKSYFKQRGMPFLESNMLQAMVPEACQVLENKLGTANGMLFHIGDGAICVSLPGVPYEMKFLMETYVFGEISKKFNLPKVIHRTILTQGVGESFLAETIKDWEDDIRNKGVDLAYLPSPGAVKLRLSGYNSEAERRINESVDELKKLIGEYIYGEGNVSLVEVVIELLRNSNLTVSTAESCTGGLIAQRITEVSGSSETFRGGIVAYQEDVKVRELGVLQTTIDNCGVVSEEVAIEMAKNCRRIFATDYAISTTGWAGPNGGDEKNGVGTIFVALSCEKFEKSIKLNLGKTRSRNREIATLHALMMVFRDLSF